MRRVYCVFYHHRGTDDLVRIFSTEEAGERWIHNIIAESGDTRSTGRHITGYHGEWYEVEE